MERNAGDIGFYGMLEAVRRKREIDARKNSVRPFGLGLE